MAGVGMTARVRALVVDDEPLARRRILSFLADEPEIDVIGEAGTGSAAVEAIAGKRPDLVFLDVQMPGLDGFGVLRCIAGAHRPAVVFVTAHDEHAIRAFEVQAVDYLLKPVSAVRFREAVKRAVARVRSAPAGQPDGGAIERLLTEVEDRPDQAGRLAFRADGRTVLIPVSEIDWIQADGDHVRIHAGPAVHVARQPLGDLVDRVPADRLVRIHRSVVVNPTRVRAIESIEKGGYLVVLRDGTKLRSGRRFREAVQALAARG